MKLNTRFGIIFMAIGILIFTLTFASFKNTINFTEKSIKTQAVITNIESYTENETINHKIYIDYELNNQNYSTYITDYSFSMYEGKEITVLVNAENPTQVRYHIWLGPCIFLFFSIAFCTFGLRDLILATKEALKQKKAKKYGKQITAKIIDIGVQTNISINNKHPQYLICEYDGLYGKQIFKSESRMDFYDDLIGMDITVYFVDEKIYYVDLDSIKY